MKPIFVQLGLERRLYGKFDDDQMLCHLYIRINVITCGSSRAKLSYNDAQQVLEGGQLPQSASLVDPNQASDIETSIKDLMALARHLRKRRFANGALALESVKLTFDFDDEGEPTAVSNFEAQDSNKLIEEFMLLANTHVAQKISSAYNREALLRRHAPPILRRMVCSFIINGRRKRSTHYY